MIEATYISHPLHFKRPSGTSRGVFHKKPCWFLVLTDQDGLSGLGEVSFIPGLSMEDPMEIEIQLDHVCKLVSKGEMDPKQRLPSLPGVQFALETALLDLQKGGDRILFESEFTSGEAGILINGLIWMGDRSFMKQQVRKKIEQGFRVLKMKVGALEPEMEIEVLNWIRSEFGAGDLEIRLDANGAWSAEKAPERMIQFSKFGIHSIEQPIKPGQWDSMANLCSKRIIPVALDEELTGVTNPEDREQMLKKIKPDYLILKPGILGGFSEARQWIELGKQTGSAWWITSALESSIGLSAISQWTYQLGVSMPQGLGTGEIYDNNIPSPLSLEGDKLWFRRETNWKLDSILHT